MIVRRDIGRHNPPSLDHLWKCYPSKEGLELEKIKTHMTRMSWLCNGKWNPDRLSKDGLKERPGVTEHPAFKCIVDIFNDLLQYHQSPEGRRGVESTSFDGSSMLDVVPLLLESLRELAEKAEEISIEESTVPSTVERLATGIIVGQCQSPPQAATPQAESDIAGPFRGIDTGT